MQYLYLMGKQFYCNGTLLPKNYVPYLSLGDMSDTDAFEAELEENTQREDLTWIEKAAAVLQLHELRQKQLIEQGAAAGEVYFPKQTTADTALEIHGRSDGFYQDVVRKQIIVAKHMSDPDVTKAKNLQDAFKLLKNKEVAANHRAKGEAIPSETLKGQHSLFLSSFSLLKLEPKYDIIITDPPYGMGAETFNTGSRVMDFTHEYDDSYNSWKNLMINFAEFSWKVTKPEAHLYCFCDFDRFHELKELLANCGWWVHRTPLVFSKDGASSVRVPWTEHGPRRSYELVLYAVKGKKPVNLIAMDLFWAAHDSNLGHAAQKPVAAYVELLRRSAKPGDQVLDPFCGSGPIFPACQELKLVATGIEIDPGYYSIAADRLGGLV
jgi:DNA modification methylase